LGERKPWGLEHRKEGETREKQRWIDLQLVKGLPRERGEGRRSRAKPVLKIRKGQHLKNRGHTLSGESSEGKIAPLREPWGVGHPPRRVRLLGVNS